MKDATHITFTLAVTGYNFYIPAEVLRSGIFRQLTDGCWEIWLRDNYPHITLVKENPFTMLGEYDSHAQET